MLNRKLQPLCIGIFITSTLLGCGDKGLTDQGKTLAKVNGEAVPETTFETYLKFKRVPLEDKARVGSQMDEYLERMAITSQIDQSSYIDRALAEIEVEEFKEQMLISRYFDEFLKDKVNDTAIQNFYKSNAEQFQAKKMKVAHVLLRTNEGMSESEISALGTKAQEVYSKATSSEDFSKLAEQYSQDSRSAKKGGEIGWIKKGAIDPKFSETVFALKKGDISQPFQSAYGFHVVKVLEAPVVEKAPLESVRGDIRYQLRQQAKETEMARLIQAAKIERL